MNQRTRTITCPCGAEVTFVVRPGAPPKYCPDCRPPRRDDLVVLESIPAGFAEAFPVTLNKRPAERYATHWRTIVRWARALGLEKDPAHVSEAIASKRRKPVEVEGFKRCIGCEELKPLDNFYAANGGRTKMARCKPCYHAKTDEWRDANPEARKRIGRRAALKKAYGITEVDWDRMFAEQGGKCAICGGTDDGTKAARRLHVDHCHQTGEVRGLLCGSCNNGIGRFDHDVDLLQKAIDYLRVTA